MKTTVQFFFIQALFLINNVLFSQTPMLQWANNTGSSTDEFGYSVVDKQGNIYTTGVFQGIVDFNPGAGTFNLNSNNGSVFIQKLNASGNFVWAIQLLSSSGSNKSNCIALDASNNILIGGSYYDIGNQHYAFIWQYSDAGNLINYQDIGPSSSANITNIKCDAQNRVYVLGAIYLSSGSYYDGIARYDANLSLDWSQYLPVKVKKNTALAVTEFGSCYITGSFKNTVYFGGLSGIALSGPSGGLDNLFLCKFDAAGNIYWAKQIDPIYVSTSDNNGNAIVLDNYGALFFTGSYVGNPDFDFGSGVSQLPPTITSHIGTFISKYDLNGNFIWAKGIVNGTDHNTGYGVATDTSGNAYYTGTCSGILDFDPSSATYTLSGTSGAFVSKLDASGNFKWAAKINNSATGQEIHVTSIGDVYTVGNLTGTTDFDPSNNTYNLATNGGYDIFIQKLIQCIAPSVPTNSTLIANQTICSGTTTTLSAVASGTVNWYTSSTGGSIIATGLNYTTGNLSAGTYTYYAEANTCTVSATRAAIMVTVNSTPTLTINTNNTLICSGQTAVLTASGANTYTWNTGANTNAISVNPTSTSTYTAVGTSTNGCSNISMITQSVSVCTGIESLSTDQGIAMYPNPTNGLFTLELTSFSQLIITNTFGQELINEMKSEGKHLINIENQATGIYIIKLITNGKQRVAKLVKE